MKSSIFSLAFVVSLVAAQAEELPRCAVPCVTKYTTGNTIAGCPGGKIDCICKNEEFLDGIACCLLDECDESGRAAAIRFAAQICATAGVEVPNEVICKDSSSATGSASEAPSGSATGSASEAAGTSAAGSQTSAASAESATAAPTTTTEPNAAVGLDSGLLGAVAAIMLAL